MAMSNQSHQVNQLYMDPTNDEDYYFDYIMTLSYTFVTLVYTFGYFNVDVCCFGSLSNTLVLIVFFKDGLDSTSNISFFCLGITDFLSCVCL